MKKLLVLLFFVCFTTSVHSDMEESIFTKIKSLNQLETSLSNPKKTLVIFDVDYVLTHPSDPVFQMPTVMQNMSKAKTYFTSLPVSTRDAFASLMVLEDGKGCCLIEEGTPSFIKKLHDQGFNTLALTASLAGKVIGDKAFYERRYEELSNLGITFTMKHPSSDSPYLYTEYEKNFNSHPVFYRGILFANGENMSKRKGKLLKDFLSQIDWTPERVLFVDDRVENLKDVKDALKEAYPQIEYTGFLYEGAFTCHSEMVSQEEFDARWSALTEKARKLCAE